MDINIQETPEVEAGDLIFIDDMMRGRQLMVININLDIVSDDGKKKHYRYGLVDLERNQLNAMFETSYHLQQQVDKWMCSVKKSKDYTMHLRKK